MKHLALDPARVLHTDHYIRQQRFEHTRRRKVIRRSHFTHVDAYGISRFRAAHAEPGDQRLRIGKNILADPGERQVRKDLILGGEMIQLDRRATRLNEIGVGQYHALRMSRGSRRVEHRRGIGCTALGDFLIPKRTPFLVEAFAALLHGFEGVQLRLLIVTQAAWIVVDDVLELGALRQDFEQLTKGRTSQPVSDPRRRRIRLRRRLVRMRVPARSNPDTAAPEPRRAPAPP